MLQAYCTIDGVPVDVLITGTAQNRAVSARLLAHVATQVDRCTKKCEVLYNRVIRTESGDFVHGKRGKIVIQLCYKRVFRFGFTYTLLPFLVATRSVGGKVLDMNCSVS
jgi:hypothetical protein